MALMSLSRTARVVGEVCRLVRNFPRFPFVADDDNHYEYYNYYNSAHGDGDRDT